MTFFAETIPTPREAGIEGREEALKPGALQEAGNTNDACIICTIVELKREKNRNLKRERIIQGKL